MIGKPNDELRFKSGSMSISASPCPIRIGAAGNASLSRPVAGDVINVAVGVHDGDECEAVFGQAFEDGFRLEAGIDDECVGRPIHPDDVGVFGKRLRLDRPHLDTHGRPSGCSVLIISRTGLAETRGGRYSPGPPSEIVGCGAVVGDDRPADGSWGDRRRSRRCARRGDVPMTVRELFHSRVWSAVLAGGGFLSAAVASPPSDVLIPPGPPAGATLPPLVWPVVATIPNAERVLEVAPAPTPHAVPKAIIRETARPIPPEPAKLVARQPIPAITQADPPKVTGPSTTARPVRFEDEAKSVIEFRPGTATADALAMFEGMIPNARAAYGKVRDYSCHFIRQERVKGKLLPEQTAELYAKSTPHRIAYKVIAPSASAGAEMVYVAGQNAGKVRVKPAGSHSREAWMSLDPNDPRAMTDSRNGIAGVGIGSVIDRLEKVIAIERRMRNPISVRAADYVFAGRPVVRYEVITARPHALRYAHTLVVCVDKETKLPVRFEAYDTPISIGQTGELLECHSYVNVRLNAIVGDGVFEK